MSDLQWGVAWYSYSCMLCLSTWKYAIFFTGIFVQEENSEQVKFLMDGKVDHRKTLNCVPHDIGDPGEMICDWLNLIFQFEFQCNNLLITLESVMSL